MTTLYAIEEIPLFLDSEDYEVRLIGSNEINQDRLFAVDGDLTAFKADYPQAKDYYESEGWFLNFYPDATGDSPLEKYLNAINGVGGMNPPNWTNIIGAISSNVPIFLKFLTTQQPNFLTGLIESTKIRNMDTFKFLAKGTIAAIPGGLTQQEGEELNAILLANNFPSLTEIMQ